MGAGVVVEWLLPPRLGEPVRRAMLRTIGHRATWVGAASLIVGAIDAADEVAARRGRAGAPARVLGSVGATLIGVGIASWSISRYHRTEDLGVLPPAVDPLTGAPATPVVGGVPGADSLSPVAKSLAPGAAVSAGLEGIAYADSLLSRGVAVGVRRVEPGDRPFAKPWATSAVHRHLHQAHRGWTATVTHAPLHKAVNVGGATITKAPRTVTWTAQPGNSIAPGHYQEFDLATDALPAAGQVVLPAAQFYSDATVTYWSEPTVSGKAETEHPAPAFTIIAANGTSASAAAADSTARVLGGAALLVSLVSAGLVLPPHRPKAEVA